MKLENMDSEKLFKELEYAIAVMKNTNSDEYYKKVKMEIINRMQVK